MCVLLLIVLVQGCYQNEYIKPYRTGLYGPKDYFEHVNFYGLRDDIPASVMENLEKIGEIEVQDSYDINGKLIKQCREMGGDVVKVNSLETDPWYGYDQRCRASIYRIYEGFLWVNQIIQKGQGETRLLNNWVTVEMESYEGIYQSITADNNYKFKVGFYKESNGKYSMVYLDGMNGIRSWKEGDIIGLFDAAAYRGVFLGKWIKLDKFATPAELVFNDNGSFSVSYQPWNSKTKLESTYIKTYPKGTVEVGSGANSSTGTGFLLSTKGYVVTCHHVVSGAKRIYVIDNNRSKTRLLASVAIQDANNDLCILKVNGLSLEYGSSLPYGFDEALNKTGESVFCMGYPLTQVMGNEIKVTNGIISSVTGYKGDVSSYQFSAPAQPGNSGGPLINSSGNVIGVVNSKISQAENVSYAVKTSYLSNLVGLLSDDVRISKTTQTSSSLSSLVEKFKPAVYIIEVEY